MTRDRKKENYVTGLLAKGRTPVEQVKYQSGRWEYDRIRSSD
jgi:hypothetical protein